MVAPVRRVVTGHDENGMAVVIFDGDAPNVRVREHGTGSTTRSPPCESYSAARRAASSGKCGITSAAKRSSERADSSKARSP